MHLEISATKLFKILIEKIINFKEIKNLKKT